MLGFDSYISIHAPRGGSDLRDAERVAALLKFQSTLPVGGATIAYFSRVW